MVKFLLSPSECSSLLKRLLSLGCSYTHHCHFKVLAPWTPRVVTCFCWCLAVRQLLFSDCMVRLYFSHSPKTSPTTALFIAWYILAWDTPSELRGASAMHCLWTFLYLSALFATQRKVCNAKVRFCTRTSSHLWKWFPMLACLTLH